ncbi:MAG: ParB/RepB/Spo0J family partition protein [Lachnospiraceae bacterium]|nr:ParB/RepB/Spo0J family partition protein [Lachnospiraceae bacterium]
MLSFENINFLRGAEKDETEKVQMFRLSDLHEFDGHTFKVRDDRSMQELVESVMRKGVLEPIIVRPRITGGVEVVSGHRRWHASEIAGLSEIPGIMRNLDDDDAIIFMNDANLKREYISPMERAASYKARYEAMDRKQLNLGLADAGARMTVRAKMAQEIGDTESNVQRYIKLNELIPEFKELVDQEKIPVYLGAELAALSEENQRALHAYAGDFKFKYDKETVISLRQLERQGKLNEEKIYSVLSKNSADKIRDDMAKKKYKVKLRPEVIDRIPSKISDRNRFIEDAIDYYIDHIKEKMPQKKKDGKEKCSP